MSTKKIVLSEEEIREVKKIYEIEKGSINDVARYLDCCRFTARKKMVEQGIEIRPITTYKEDGSVFNRIDSEESAYWLGFLYADGSVLNNRNRIQIRLQLSDKKHLEKFKSFTSSTSPVKTYKECHEFSLYNAEMKEDLIRWGCVPNKGNVLTFPTFLREELVRHFIRGYFDGDGTVFENWENKQGKKTWNLALIGTHNMMEYIRDYWGLKSKSYVYGSRDQLLSIRATSLKKTKECMKNMYNGATVYLDRKKEIYDNIIEQENSPF